MHCKTFDHSFTLVYRAVTSKHSAFSTAVLAWIESQTSPSDTTASITQPHSKLNSHCVISCWGWAFTLYVAAVLHFHSYRVSNSHITGYAFSRQSGTTKTSGLETTPRHALINHHTFLSSGTQSTNSITEIGNMFSEYNHKSCDIQPSLLGFRANAPIFLVLLQSFLIHEGNLLSRPSTYARKELRTWQY